MSLALTHKKIQQPITDNRPTWIEWVTIFLLIAFTANGFFNGSIEILFLSTGVLFIFWFMKDDNSTRLNNPVGVRMCMARRAHNDQGPTRRYINYARK